MAQDKSRSIQRQVAKKADIGMVQASRYIRSEGEWEPNYILTKEDEKISRVNIIASVISRNDLQSPDNLTIDDGSGKITVRTFQNPQIFSNISVGDIVLLIARPREFSNELYLVPEIIKKIENPKWVELRRLELAIIKKSSKRDKKEALNENNKMQPLEQHQQQQETPNDVKEEKVSSDPKTLSDTDRIYQMIEELDREDGVDIEEIIERSKIPNAEKILNSFLESGTIFELKPGRVKILS